MENVSVAYIFSGHLRTFKNEWFNFNENSDIYIYL